MKGYSIHIGINTTNPDVYNNLPSLKAAVNDAKWWQKYAEELDYETLLLTDQEAQSGKILSEIEQRAQTMQPGDIILITYSGHGGTFPNEKPSHLDTESMDQTWCLYDRQLIDDELYEAFKSFKEGTRILIVSDSCHSGTVTKDIETMESPGKINLTEVLIDGIEQSQTSRGFANRKLPAEVEKDILTRDYTSIYVPIQEKFKYKSKRSEVKASVKLLAACQDDQSTYDGEKYGLFTGTLNKLFLQDGFSGNAREIIAKIKKYYTFPHPNCFEYGSVIESFDKGFPFAINIENADTLSGYLNPTQTSVKDIIANNDITTGNVDKNALLLVEFQGEAPQLEEGDQIKIIKQKGTRFTLEALNIPYEQGWTAAHALKLRLKQSGYEATVEPILSFSPADDKRITRASNGDNEYIPEWPPALENPTVKIGWHLDDKHSQLSAAAQKVMAKTGSYVTIGHLDTGYLPGHIGLPEKLRADKEKNFVTGKDEIENQAHDKIDSGNDGHGLGTLCLLAGNNVPFSSTFNEFQGYIGGVPIADVIPMRISDSVVILNTENFCDAIDYALEQGCEVVTMSMAGKPSPRMAKSVNKAYEAGLVIVSAASNCWYAGFFKSLLPKCVLYPAAFQRVIAATGAMYNQKPYDKDFLNTAKGEFTKYMQGSWGPPSSMTRALAAYTPNTPWAENGDKFVRSGGGTSSATPQIAAAAALWIAYHRDELEAKGYYKPGQQWKKIEAVRYALYTSAAKASVFKDWQKYYGNGILRAMDALNIGVPDENLLTKSPEAESSFGGITQILVSFFKNRKLFRDTNTLKPEEEQLSLELMHLLQTDPAFFEDFSHLDMSNTTKAENLISNDDFQKKVLESPFASPYLKEAFVK